MAKPVNIEIKEMPETSKVHKVESVNYEVPQAATGNESKREKASFMSQTNQARMPESPDLHAQAHEFMRLASENSKARPAVDDQTGSTMNIKSYSGYESLKDSIHKETLMSPGVEIQNVHIPEIHVHAGLADDVPGGYYKERTPERQNEDFEQSHYKTTENYLQQHEHQLRQQSNNSTMLMESIKDHQISGIWGGLTRKRRGLPAAAQQAGQHPDPDAGEDPGHVV